MKSAELNVIRFGTGDVIATSGLLMSGLGDDDPNNNVFNGAKLSTYADKDANFVLQSGQNEVSSVLQEYSSDSGEYNGYYKMYSSDDYVPDTVGGGDYSTYTFGQLWGDFTFYLHQ